MADNPESVADINTDLEPVTAEVGAGDATATLQPLSETVIIQPLTTEVTV
jgi:hypothetical protein